jgi:ABC-type multidrug transport system permease subunit
MFAAHPLFQLVLARHREFYREPEAVFWVFIFPIIMTVGLGVAFRNRPQEEVAVDIRQGGLAETTLEDLSKQPRFVVSIRDEESCRLRLRTGKTSLIITAHDTPLPHYEYTFDPTRPDSVLARREADDVLQRASGRQDPGSRYIDFLIPGLLGMNLMGGGLWGIGFVTVDMRIRKLLKRYVATPMKKRHFLGALIVSRLLFMMPEIAVLLVFARFAFGVVIQGSVLAVVFLILLGAITFAGIGLLVASRAQTIEAVSGLMNLVMMPMWLLSGIFFSSERFPAVVRPLIKALPLTALNDVLRSVMLEGSSLGNHPVELAILAAYGVVTFALALWWFRWN